MTSHIELPDTKQTPFQLTAIQLTGVTSIPVLATSVLILSISTFQNALYSILVGNFFIFFIRLAIARMSFSERKSTLDISRDYTGKVGSYFIAVLLLLSTVAWFVVQTTIASQALAYLIPINESQTINSTIQISIGLGIISTLVCMEGIVLLRWISIFALPILFITFIIILSRTTYIPIPSKMTSFSLSGLSIVLATSLGVTADLPTFFRHSRSWRDSFLALLYVQAIGLGLAIGGLYLASIITPHFSINLNNPQILSDMTLRIALITLVFVSGVIANVANVYSASVGWELIAPALAGRKEYLILGLGLTIIFILIAHIFSLTFLLDITDSALVNLCLVLVIGYLITLLTKTPPSSRLKIVYFFSWLITSTINILQSLGLLLSDIPLLVPPFVILALIFLLTLSIQKVWK